MAIEAKDVFLCKFFLQCCPDAAFEKDYRGDTPLLAAIRAGSVDLVRCLVDADPSLETLQIHDGKGYLPLAIAAMRGEVEIVKLLLDADDSGQAFRGEIGEIDAGKDTHALVVFYRAWPDLPDEARIMIDSALRSCGEDEELMFKMATDHILKLRDYSLAQHALDVLCPEGIELSSAVTSKDPRLVKMVLDTVPFPSEELSEGIEMARAINATEIVELLEKRKSQVELRERAPKPQPEMDIETVD
jgi:Ankyrin repeats (3 copies)